MIARGLTIIGFLGSRSGSGLHRAKVDVAHLLAGLCYSGKSAGGVTREEHSKGAVKAIYSTKGRQKLHSLLE